MAWEQPVNSSTVTNADEAVPHLVFMLLPPPHLVNPFPLSAAALPNRCTPQSPSASAVSQTMPSAQAMRLAA
jgi:hypothetical protein